MSTSPILRSRRVDNGLLSRLVILMAIAAVLISVAFGAYYYADRYIHIGDKSPVELAIEQLEVVVAENPQNLEARLSIAQLYFENGESSKAIQHAEAVLKARPDDSAPLFLLGVAYSDMEQAEAAVASFERLVDIRRESPMAQADRLLEASLYYLGLNYLKLNQIDGAIKVLSEALEIDGTDADALFQLGVAYSLTGEHERSVEAYQGAVRFVPDFAEAYRGMAREYTALGMSARAQYARGMQSFSTKEYRQAQQDLTRAIQSLPTFAPAYLGLALTYEQLGEYGLALKNINRVLELEPDNFNASVALGRIRPSESGNEASLLHK